MNANDTHILFARNAGIHSQNIPAIGILQQFDVKFAIRPDPSTLGQALLSDVWMVYFRAYATISFWSRMNN